MATWFWYAIFAALLYGLHQVFTKLASDHIGDGLGGFVVEATAALTLALSVTSLRFFSAKGHQVPRARSFSLILPTGPYLSAGPALFFLLSPKRGPLPPLPLLLPRR